MFQAVDIVPPGVGADFTYQTCFELHTMERGIRAALNTS